MNIVSSVIIKPGDPSGWIKILFEGQGEIVLITSENELSITADGEQMSYPSLVLWLSAHPCTVIVYPKADFVDLAYKANFTSIK